MTPYRKGVKTTIVWRSSQICTVFEIVNYSSQISRGKVSKSTSPEGKMQFIGNWISDRPQTRFLFDFVYCTPAENPWSPSMQVWCLNDPTFFSEITCLFKYPYAMNMEGLVSIFVIILKKKRKAIIRKTQMTDIFANSEIFWN